MGEDSQLWRRGHPERSGLHCCISGLTWQWSRTRRDRGGFEGSGFVEVRSVITFSGFVLGGPLTLSVRRPGRESAAGSEANTIMIVGVISDTQISHENRPMDKVSICRSSCEKMGIDIFFYT
jgi:hypothetical protein